MATSNLAVSFKDSRRFNTQLDKVTQNELNTNLNNIIDESYSHIMDEVMHITQEERNKWNNIASSIKISSSDQNGLMSAADKIKLDGISEGANRYIHPNSGVTPGTYLRTSVNAEGHVIYGDNPERLDITVTNSNKLGNKIAGDYALLNNPTFTGIVKVPNITMVSNESAAVNLGFLKENTIDNTIVYQGIPPTNTKQLWVNSADKLVYYYNTSTNTWTPFSERSNTVHTDSNGKIPSNLLPSIEGVPYGFIGLTCSQLPPDGFQFLDGTILSRTACPQLWEFARTSGSIITDADWVNRKNSGQESVGLFSHGDGANTFRVPLIISYVRGGYGNKVGEWLGDGTRVGDNGIIGTFTVNSGAYCTNGGLGYSSGNYGGNPTGAFSRTVRHLPPEGRLSRRKYDIFDTADLTYSMKMPNSASETLPKSIRMSYVIKAFPSGGKGGSASAYGTNLPGINYF